MAMELHEIYESDELLEIGRKAIEEELIKWRDSRLSVLHRGNGLVVREADGKESSIIRFGPEHGMKIGLMAIAAHIRKTEIEADQER